LNRVIWVWLAAALMPAATTPFAPTGVTATAGDAKVTLTWNASAGATGYTVYRGTSAALAPLATVGPGALAFLDTGVTNGTTYYYFVRAQAEALLSPPSQVVAARPLPLPPPPVINVTASPGNAQVVLNWTPVGGAVGYRILRATMGVWETSPVVVPQPPYKQTGLVNGTAYSFKVAAYNLGGLGPYSFAVPATPVAPPAAPTGVVATPGDKLVTLTWTPVAGAAGYNIYRGPESNLEATVPMAAGVASPTFADRAVENGSRYYYKLTAVNGGGESSGSAEVNATPQGATTPVDATTAAAFQFLRQTTWGPRPGDVDMVKTLGKDAFLAAQFSTPATNYPSSLFDMSVGTAQAYFMSMALGAPDQLRQRVAWALHKIWVVSAVEVASSPALVTYHRELMKGAFGNYRDLMRAMSLNAAMGRYLNMLNNRSQAVTGMPPNENYARELMQLFTVGIPALNQNGTPVLSGGNQIPVYTEQDVKELARILTGWTFGGELGRENYAIPMQAIPAYHDSGAKRFLGQNFPAGQSALQDLEQALDLLFNHPNVGPFVGRQLIQQLVTSNPSPAYVAAVAAVFNNNGAGMRGDLAAVARAIVLHPEAGAPTATSGKLSEPVLFVTSTLRALNATVNEYRFVTARVEAMGQNVFYPGSVFGYFSPAYRVNGTNAGGGIPLGGPEFQILTAVTAMERANFVGALLAGAYGSSVTIDYSPFAGRASDAAALVDYCNLLFMGGRMSSAERTEIINVVSNTSSNNAGERVSSALYLTLTAAQAQVDR
jgi:uncharacterized protein (DUF1800 family)